MEATRFHGWLSEYISMLRADSEGCAAEGRPRTPPAHTQAQMAHPPRYPTHKDTAKIRYNKGIRQEKSPRPSPWRPRERHHLHVSPHPPPCLPLQQDMSPRTS